MCKCQWRGLILPEFAPHKSLSRSRHEIPYNLPQVFQGGSEVFEAPDGNADGREEGAPSSMLSSRSQKMVEVGLVALAWVLVGEATEGRLRPLAPESVLRVAAGYKVVQVGTGKGVGL